MAHLKVFLIYCVLIIPMLSVEAAQGANCKLRMDLVIAMDTTSSQEASLFEDVKAVVKKIVTRFTIGPADTRLALLSISQQVRVVVNLNQVNDLSDFNRAVDSLAFSTGTADLAAGMKLARESVLNIARTQKTSTVLILLKDRRSIGGVVSSTAALSQVTSEAAAIKALGAVIQAVGAGGIWNRQELVALFGTEYLLFKDANKAFESAKSLNNLNCEANCPNKGKSFQLPGLCNDGMQHVISAKVSLEDSAGLSVCRTEIERSFSPCSGTQQCNKVDRVVGPCTSNGKVSIESSWQSYNFKLQTCETTKSVQTVDCKDSLTCTGQVADVIFILDRSSSIGDQFPVVKRATRTLIEALSIGPDSVRVGIITFDNKAYIIAPLGSRKDKASVLRALEGIPDAIVGRDKATYTNVALYKARQEFAQFGRSDAAKFIFLITDGESTQPEFTFYMTGVIKNESVTLYAIGVGRVKVSELRTMTEPESDTHMILVDNFNEFERWSADFSKRICSELSAPNPKLCDNGVFKQSVSECTYGQQQVARTEYKYDALRKCIKSTQTKVVQRCVTKCIDPVDGNEYLDGIKWTSRCHRFQCSATRPLLPTKSYCMSADGQCKDVGSQAFKCLDEKGKEFNNCKCIMKSGKVILLIETQ